MRLTSHMLRRCCAEEHQLRCAGACTPGSKHDTGGATDRTDVLSLEDQWSLPRERGILIELVPWKLFYDVL